MNIPFTIKNEVLLNLYALLVNNITDNMRYIFINMTSNDEVQFLIVFYKKQLEIEEELIDDVCDNLIANSKYINYCNVKYEVDSHSHFQHFSKDYYCVFGRYDDRVSAPEI